MFKSLLSTIFNKLTSVFNVCPVIDHEFRHNIVKIATETRGDSRKDLQATLTMLRLLQIVISYMQCNNKAIPSVLK